MTLILASQSPRRREILEQLGVQFSCSPADIDETPRVNERPDDYVLRLAIEKAQTVASNNSDVWVLGSDTSVILDNTILGKPQSKSHGVEMLLQLSNRSHQVMTGIALVRSDVCLSRLVTTNVNFGEITPAMAEAYWQTKEPCDKAGAYGIQGKGGVFVRSITGSYSAVVGLPVAETADLLMEADIEGWWSWRQE